MAARTINIGEGKKLTFDFSSLFSLIQTLNSNEQCIAALEQERWSDGDNYTNTIEGFWGQFKRSIFGIYHFVSAKYLQRYVDESVFRYNTRNWKQTYRFYYMFARCIGKFTYEDVRKIA